VARAHNGEMSILPREGGGCIVRFTLPYQALIPRAYVTANRSIQA
jgi:signal transduction histidine kinase